MAKEFVSPTPDEIAEKASHIKGDRFWLAAANLTGQRQRLESLKTHSPQKLIDAGNWVSDKRLHCTAFALAVHHAGVFLDKTESKKLRGLKALATPLKVAGTAGALATAVGDSLDGFLVRQAMEADPTLKNPDGPEKDQEGDAKSRALLAGTMLARGDKMDRAILGACLGADLGLLSIRTAAVKKGERFVVSMNGKVKQVVYSASGVAFLARDIVSHMPKAGRIFSASEKVTAVAGGVMVTKDLKERIQAGRARKKAARTAQAAAKEAASAAPDFID